MNDYPPITIRVLYRAQMSNEEVVSIVKAALDWRTARAEKSPNDDADHALAARIDRVLETHLKDRSAGIVSSKTNLEPSEVTP